MGIITNFTTDDNKWNNSSISSNLVTPSINFSDDSKKNITSSILPAPPLCPSIELTRWERIGGIGNNLYELPSANDLRGAGLNDVPDLLTDFKPSISGFDNKLYVNSPLNITNIPSKEEEKENIKKAIKPGDVIVQRNKDYHTWLVVSKVFADSDYVHSAIYAGFGTDTDTREKLKDKIEPNKLDKLAQIDNKFFKDKDEFTEKLKELNFDENEIKTIMEHGDNNKGKMIESNAKGVNVSNFDKYLGGSDDIKVVRPEYKTEEDRKKVVEFAQKQLGKPYDVLFNKNPFKDKDDAFFCTELVSRSLKEGNIDVPTGTRENVLGLTGADAFLRIPGAQVLYSSGDGVTSLSDSLSVLGTKALSSTMGGLHYVGDKAWEGALYAGEKTWEGTKYVGEKTWEGTKYVGEKTWEGTKYVGEKTWEGTKYVGEKTWEGTKYVGEKTWEGTKYVGEKTWEGTKYVGEKTWEGTKYAGQAVSTGFNATVNAIGGAASWLLGL